MLKKKPLKSKITLNAKNKYRHQHYNVQYEHVYLWLYVTFLFTSIIKLCILKSNFKRVLDDRKATLKKCNI